MMMNFKLENSLFFNTRFAEPISEKMLRYLLHQGSARDARLTECPGPRPRALRLSSSGYGGNILRYKFRNYAATKRVSFFPGLGQGFRDLVLGLGLG